MATLTFAAACSDGGSNDAAPDNGGTEVDATPPAPANARDDVDREAGAAVELPDHLPVEVAPGGKIDGVFEPSPGTAQSTWVARVLYPEGTYEDVAAFYDEHLTELGLDVENGSAGPTRWRWSWSASSDGTVEAGSVLLRRSDRYFGGADVLEISWTEAQE
jgi:hypothetical protein